MNKIDGSGKIISNLIWKLTERILSQGMAFVVTIILARMLEPKDYGVIAIITVFIVIINVFIQSGFPSALIQKKEADELDFSSVFFLNLALAIVIYIILFFCAPIIAYFYDDKIFTSVLRASSIVIIIGAVNGVQQAYVARTMQFKKAFISSTIGTFISAIFGVSLAYLGYGVWALVIQMLVFQFCDTFVLWITVRWRPKILFSKDRLLQLYNYGWKIFAANILGTICNEIRALIIGKKYSANDLGLYSKGEQIPKLLITNICVSMQSVLFPTMSKVQENRAAVKQILKKSIHISSYVILPILMGIFVMADDIVFLVLTEKWMPIVPFLRIFCIIYALYPFQTTNVQAIQALGKSGLFLKIEIFKRIIELILIVVAINFGTFWIAFSALASSLVALGINIIALNKLIDFPFFEQLKEVSKSICACIVMGLIVYIGGRFFGNMIMRDIFQAIVGIIIYIVLSICLKIEGYSYIKNMIRIRLNTNTN